jgi:chitin synthase
MNYIFGVKHKNDGKINSHKWFYNSLCTLLDPELCLMLDIGTRPLKNSLVTLYKYIMARPDCGGCCGEIEVDMHEKMDFVTYMLRASQFYEYKLGHTPDKCNESFFGYTSVLPGAYSMFRWDAIKGPPLYEFFRGNDKMNLSCGEANIFLSEDRVMCLEILIKRKCGYFLKYIPDAKAVTDAPGKLNVLIK